jgi:hypothetical protein
MQIKMMQRSCLTPDRIAAIKKTNTTNGEDVKEKEPLNTVGRNVN